MGACVTNCRRTGIRTNIDLLELGTTVLCDRYTFYCIAFSASKGLPYECRSPDVDMPATDLVVSRKRKKPQIRLARLSVREMRDSTTRSARFLVGILTSNLERVTFMGKVISTLWVNPPSQQPTLALAMFL